VDMLAVVPGAGHNLHRENYKEFMGLLDGFLLD
jgi:pimeloyl-ACP methyl ester carboxylesterase